MKSSEEPTAAARLQAALERLADSLAGADMAGVLDAELRIADALDAMPPELPDDEAVRNTWRRDLDACRVALLRCRRLGAALTDVVRMTVTPDGATPYTRAGATPAPPRRGSLEARV